MSDSTTVATPSGGPDTRPPSAAPSGRRRLADFGSKIHPARYSGLYVWALLIAIFGLWIPDTFLTVDTAKGIGAEQAITGIAALAVLIPLTAGGFDLSVGQNVGTSALVCASLMAASHVSIPLAVVLTLAMGAGIGALNGILVAGIGVNSFIATLGMTSVLAAFGLIISDQQFIGPVPESFSKIASSDVAGIPLLVVYFVAACFVLWWLLEHNPIGRRLAATGANPEAARLAGVKTRAYTFWSFVACGAVASLGGVLLAARITTVSPLVGPEYLLPAFAACFLGMTQLKPGRFNVWGTFIALYLLATGVKGLQLAGGPVWITSMFNGVALIGAVSLAVLGEKRRSSKRSKAQTGDE